MGRGVLRDRVLAEGWRMTGSAASFFKSASCTLHLSLLLGEKNWVRGLGEGGSAIFPEFGLADDGKRRDSLSLK